MSGLAADLVRAADPCAMARAVGLDPEEWQARLLRSASRRVIVNCCRQSGKTSLVALVGLHAAMFRPGELVLVASHRLEGSSELLLKVRSWARTFGTATMGESTTELRLANGSRLLALPATTNSVRGYTSAGVVVLDEAAHVEDDEAVFGALLPSLRADGRLIVLSTPNGRRGKFSEWWHDGAGWQRFRVTAGESAQWSPERIAEAESVLGPWRAKSELWCEFTTSGSGLFDADDIRRALRPVETLF